MFNYAPVGGFFGDDDDGENDDEKAKSACVSVGTGVWNESKNVFEFRGTLPKKFSSSRDSCKIIHELRALRYEFGAVVLVWFSLRAEQSERRDCAGCSNENNKNRIVVPSKSHCDVRSTHV